ncbi:hypothetical protein EDD16DRAFT_1710660 [Pisolithus croceorrhizus]|nr:hypothetical protein EDD16DRAFT_1710660 [Pisolithus croceorrhizus]
MDYRPYYPPITLRRIFDRDRSPSPSASNVTLRRIFDSDTARLSQEQEAKPSPNGLIPRPRGALSKTKSRRVHIASGAKLEREDVQRKKEGLHEYLLAVVMFLNAARARFPVLNDYQDQWPAQDFAAMYLKNKAGADKAKLRVRTRCTNTSQTILDG